MAKPPRSSRIRRSAGARRPLVLLASSAAAAVGLSLTQRLIRKRLPETGQPLRGGGSGGGSGTVPAPAGLPRAPGRPDDEPVSTSLRRIYREGRRALAKLRKRPSDRRWLELRHHTRALVDALRRLEAPRPDRVKKLARRADRLSSVLGEAEELRELEQRVAAGTWGADDVGTIRRLIVGRRDELRTDALRLARRLYRRKPGQVVRRLGLA